MRKNSEKYVTPSWMSLLPLTKMIAMRNHRQLSITALAMWVCMLCSAQSKAQNTYFLNVDTVLGFPDTIYDGQTISFTMLFTNQSALGFQGNIETVLSFPVPQTTITADSSVMNANFVASQAQETVIVTHFFTSNDDHLAIGDNVVVVWPRITFGPTVPPQEALNPKIVTFYLAPPLSAPAQFREGSESLGLYPNPTEGDVRWKVPAGERVVQVVMTDISGRQVILTPKSECTLSTQDVPSGLYSITALCASGKVYRGRLMVR